MERLIEKIIPSGHAATYLIILDCGHKIEMSKFNEKVSFLLDIVECKECDAKS